MTPSQIFSVANGVAALSWVLLALLPRRPWVRTITGRIVPIAIAVLYVVLVVLHIGDGPGGFSTLSDVALLFTNPWALVAGWIHYLAFDLFVGTWQAADADAHHIPQLLLIPCLALTFLFGPAGLLLYLIVRTMTVGRREGQLGRT